MGQRNEHAGKVNLGDQLRVCDQAVAGTLQGPGKIIPPNQSAEDKQEVWRSVRRQAGEPSKDPGENHRGSQRLQDHPDHTQDSLFVTQLEVPPDQHPKQIAIVPQLGQIDCRPATSRFEHAERALRVAAVGFAPIGSRSFNAIGAHFLNVRSLTRRILSATQRKKHLFQPPASFYFWDMPSFDIVSQVNPMEIENAVNQAKKELANRFDFKGSKAEIVLENNEVMLSAEDQFKIKA